MAARGADGWRLRRFFACRQPTNGTGYGTSWKVPKIGKLTDPVRASHVLGDPTRYLRPRAEAQLGQDVFEVALNRPLRQEQTLGDGAARHPGGNQLGDLQLALAQAPGLA